MASTTQPQNTEALTVQTSPLILEFAQALKMQPKTMWDTVMKTVMPTDKPVTVAQVLAFLNVANTYKLNPFLKQIYAFPDKRGGIVPMVPIDGWVDLVQRHPQYDGFEEDFEFEKILEPQQGGGMREKRGKVISCTVTLYRKDQGRPSRHTEYFDECVRDTEPWKKWPTRMLSHKAYIQCARKAFGFSGIYDEDEAERIVEAGGTGIIDGGAIEHKANVPNISSGAAAALKEKIESKKNGGPSPEPQTLEATEAHTDEPPVTEEQEDAPPTEHAQEAKSETRTEGPMVAEWGEDGTVTGTVTKMFAPQKKGSGTRVGVQMAGPDNKTFDFSIWDTKLQAFLKPLAPEGKVCTFIYKEKGQYLHIEGVLRVGNREWERDGTPIVSSDEAPLLTQNQGKS